MINVDGSAEMIHVDVTSVDVHLNDVDKVKVDGMRLSDGYAIGIEFHEGDGQASLVLYGEIDQLAVLYRRVGEVLDRLIVGDTTVDADHWLGLQRERTRERAASLIEGSYPEIAAALRGEQEEPT